MSLNMLIAKETIKQTVISVVKIVDGGLHFYFSLFFFSLFFFLLLFHFLFLEQLRLGIISHTVTSVTR